MEFCPWATFHFHYITVLSGKTLEHEIVLKFTANCGYFGSYAYLRFIMVQEKSMLSWVKYGLAEWSNVYVRTEKASMFHILCGFLTGTNKMLVICFIYWVSKKTTKCLA